MMNTKDGSHTDHRNRTCEEGLTLLLFPNYSFSFDFNYRLLFVTRSARHCFQRRQLPCLVGPECGYGT
jgi:hypothetical protein